MSDKIRNSFLSVFLLSGLPALYLSTLWN